MKPIRTFLFIAVTLLFSNHVVAQKWLWGRQGIFVSTKLPSATSAIVAAGSGNDVYAIGDLNGLPTDTVLIGTNKIPLTGHSSAFYCRYDASGNVSWVKSPSASPSTDVFYNGITSDKWDDMYVSVSSSADTVTFDTHKLVNSTPGNFISYLTKYNSYGTVGWTRKVTGLKNFAVGGSRLLSTDQQGNIYCTGSYITDSIPFDNDTLINVHPRGNTQDIFLVKLDSNDKVKWAVSAGGQGDDYPLAVAVDRYKSTYIAGLFTSPTLKLGSYTLTSTSGVSTNSFIARFDSLGNVKWAQQYANINITGICTDSNRRLYVAGYFSKDTVVFGSKRFLNHGLTSDDFFVAAYNYDTFSWANSFGTSQNEISYAITLDALNMPWVGVGFHSDTLIVDKDTIIEPLSAYNDHICLVQFDSTGNAKCFSYLAAGGYDNFSMAANTNGDIYWGGSFVSPAPVPFFVDSADALISVGDVSFFVAKFQPCQLPNPNGGNHNAVNNVINSQDINIYPNPAYDRFTIQYSGAINNNAKIELYNISGTLVYTTAITNEKTVVSTTGLAAGMYICRLVQDGYEPVYKKLIVE